MTTHYGFPNIETWQASLHISNDERTYRHYHDMAEEVYETAQAPTFDEEFGRWDVPHRPLESAIRELADMMRDDHQDVLTVGPISSDPSNQYRANLVDDIVGVWLRRVDWHRIASDMIEAVAE